MYISYLGREVATIYNMPMSGYNGTYLPSKEVLNLTVITANRYQECLWPLLKKHGFKSQITFRSNHGGDETLTLWTKIQKKYKKAASDSKNNFPNSNCSVDYGKVGTKNFCLLAANPKNDNVENLIQIKGTPIYYTVQNNALSNPKKIKPIKGIKGFKMVRMNS